MEIDILFSLPVSRRPRHAVDVSCAGGSFLGDAALIRGTPPPSRLRARQQRREGEHRQQRGQASGNGSGGGVGT